MEINSKPRDFDSRIDYGNFESNIEFLYKTKLLDKSKKMLEIGSGTGRMLAHFIKEGYLITGLEIKEELIEKSKTLYGDLPLQKVNSEKLPFENNSFDIVTSFDVFEHILNSDSHLSEVARVLVCGGYYLLQTPNKFTNVIFETIRWKSFTKWKSDHCSLHSYNQIIKRFNKCGFSVEFIEIPVVNDFFRRKIKRYLGGLGLFLIKIINPDKMPKKLKPNFYVVARKNNI